jgi:uncharacterized protein YecE (DUF72 family)
MATGAVLPERLAAKSRIRLVGRCFNSIEINATFYKLQTPTSFKKWATATPPETVFAVKGSKYITHQKKLNDIRIPLANFFASGLLELGEKLGPILWQFPPWYRFGYERIESFLGMLPKTTRAASKLASENTIKNPDNASIKTTANIPLRYAFEPRHESFFSSDFLGLLGKYNAALTFADTAGRWPYAEDLTADFAYIRLHGSTELYASGYTDEELAEWARKIKSWRKGTNPRGSKRILTQKLNTAKGLDIFVYFDNDIKAHAPYDAMNLARLLGIKTECKL